MRDLAAKIAAYLEAEAPSVSMTVAEQCRYSIITAALEFYGATINAEQFRCWSGSGSTSRCERHFIGVSRVR